MNLLPRPLLIQGSFIIRPVLVWFMKGDRFVDPIDGQGYYSLLPYGYEKQRDNVLSPGTFSLERHRLMWLYLKNETTFFSRKAKVLHIAPEQSFIKRFRAMPNLEYITSDLESPLADVKADICDLPFGDDTFDLVFCNHVLEHIPDDHKAMSELFRVMKPGGWGILQVPISYQREVTYEDPTVTTKEERKEKALKLVKKDRAQLRKELRRKMKSKAKKPDSTSRAKFENVLPQFSIFDTLS